MEALAAARPRGRRWTNVFERPGVLASVLISPAVLFVTVLVGGPLALAVWLSFTNATTGLHGKWVGLENFEFLWNDAVTRLALFNTLFYTVVASVIKFALGLWLALLLNKHLPFKAFFRAIVLLPFIVPTALSAIAFWWIYDSQFSIISWTLVRLGIIHEYIDFPGAKYDPGIAMFGFDVCVSLSRKGRRIALRKLRPSSVGKSHRVTKEEAMEFAKSALNVKLE